MKVYTYALKSGITHTREFEKKGLATHAVNVGTKCRPRVFMLQHRPRSPFRPSTSKRLHPAMRTGRWTFCSYGALRMYCLPYREDQRCFSAEMNRLSSRCC